MSMMGPACEDSRKRNVNDFIRSVSVGDEVF